MFSSNPQAQEHRLKTRYPLALSLRYRIRQRGEAGLRGNGESINVSSCGILFRTGSGEVLPAGASIELAVDWPSAGRNRNELILLGRIVYSGPEGTRVALLRHYFLRRATAGD